jgi:uncharacterized protein (DUF885 family)
MAKLKSAILVSALLGAFAAQPVAMAQELVKPAVVPKPPLMTAAMQLADLAERYYLEAAHYEPIGATINGDNRFDGEMSMAIVPAVRARHFATLHEEQAELMRIDRSKLVGGDLITYDCLAFDLNALLSLESFPDNLMPINHMDAMPVTLANFASGQGSQPLVTVANYQDFHKRLAALPMWIDAAIANMRTGMARGIVQPKALMVALLPALKTLSGDSLEKSAFMAPVRNLPASFSAFDKSKFTAAYRDTVGNAVLPSLKKLTTFVETEYLPAARTTAGWGALPDGANWYKAWSVMQTTTTMSADEIHNIGLAEMDRINAEYVKLAPKLGYTGEAAGTFRWATAQAKNRPFKTEEDVLVFYRDLNNKVMAKMPAYFATMPKAPLAIKAEPALTRDTASNHYEPASVDGTRPGVFWTVIRDAGTHSTTGMTTLFLHEGAPGHHFQIAKQQELALPSFRKFGFYNAYVEGWALYAETLGFEAGLYEDANAHLGTLKADMTRAARLVVDTGLHAKGWTREQTIAFLRDKAGDSEDAAKNATERYMAWPAQALGYKIGALKIMELRKRAAAKLGPKFNLARFHDAVLANGQLPLALLDTKINEWIATQ